MVVVEPPGEAAAFQERRAVLTGHVVKLPKFFNMLRGPATAEFHVPCCLTGSAMKVDDAPSDGVSRREKLVKVQNPHWFLLCFL